MQGIHSAGSVPSTLIHQLPTNNMPHGDRNISAQKSSSAAPHHPLREESEGLSIVWHDLPEEEKLPAETVGHQFRGTADQYARPKIIFTPAVPGHNGRGQRILRPRVALVDGADEFEVMPTPEALPSEVLNMPPVHESLVADPVLESLVPDAITQPSCTSWSPGPPPGSWPGCLPACGKIQCSGDEGIGPERLAFAPFVVDISQPFNHFRIRFDNAYDHEFPDRSEYLWAKIGGKGPPQPERLVDYQDIRFKLELAGSRFSVATEIPLRIMDPINNPNTAGMGDMSLTTKTVLVDNECWQITQLFRSYFNTGAPGHGTGNGHVSLEPGVLARYKVGKRTKLHGDLKYWFPLGADSTHSGGILNYGLAISHLAFDSDNFAMIPTLEFVGWTVLDGEQTLPNGELQPVDGLGIFNLHPGVRFVIDKGGNSNLCEVGISSGIALSSDRWYENLLRLDFRWTF